MTWGVTARLDKLNGALDAYAKKFNVDVGKLIRYVSVGIIKDLSRDTPVDKGEARAGWLPYLMKQGVSAGLKSNPATTAKPWDVGRAQQRGLRAGKYKYKFTGPKPFAWITNRVPHILFLEFGTKFMPMGSRRSRKGFTRRAIKRWHKKMHKAIKSGV